MAILATAVSLWEDGEVHILEAGDHVPDWAVDRIGPHCFSEDPVPQVREQAAEPPASTAPDFTKPAAKRGPGRPRKGS